MLKDPRNLRSHFKIDEFSTSVVDGWVSTKLKSIIMKTIKIFSSLWLLTFLLNCNNGQKTTSNGNENFPSALDQNDTPNSAIDRSEDKDTRKMIHVADSINNSAEHTATDVNENPGNTNAADNSRMTKMFAELNLNPNQIEKFNTSLHQEMNDWNKTNAGTKISVEEHRRMEDKSMKSILGAEQYQQYQKWVKDNPVKNLR